MNIFWQNFFTQNYKCQKNSNWLINFSFVNFSLVHLILGQSIISIPALLPQQVISAMGSISSLSGVSRRSILPLGGADSLFQGDPFCHRVALIVCFKEIQGNWVTLRLINISQQEPVNSKISSVLWGTTPCLSTTHDAQYLQCQNLNNF